MKVKKYLEKRLDYNYQTGDHGLFKNGCVMPNKVLSNSQNNAIQKVL